MKKTSIQIGSGLAILAILFIGASVAKNGFFGLIPRSLDMYANTVIATCAKSTYPPSCYDKELPKLMDQGLSMEETFEVTRRIQGQVNDYFYCHVLGHNLSAKETAKDPSKWTDVVARCPTGMCSNGCLHGAAQERFRDDVLTPEQVESLLPQLSQICEIGSGRSFTGLEQASCYHSLGHLTMYITGARISTAIAVCDQIAVHDTQDYRQTCYEGAYMQIFQPLEPEDFALVKEIAPDSTVSAQTFCDEFSGAKRAACYRESWPLYQDTFTSASGVTAFCSLVPDALSTKLCYNAIFYVLTARFNFDQTKITTFCNGFPLKRKAQCYGNAASRLIETDYRLSSKAAALCAVAETEGVGDRCYSELLFYSTFNFHKDSSEFVALCTLTRTVAHQVS